MIIPFTHDNYISPFDIPSWDVDRHHEITDERSKDPFSGSVPVSLDKNCGMFNKSGFDAWHRNIYEAFKSGKKPKSMDDEFVHAENIPDYYRDRMYVGRDQPEN
ncbi:hypothetical protein RvY_01686 [Ramazzottius varieornatus]|uniref:Uncharacterized protein n=1 Tax=Ramazzottius varieornatus TaxID=947166 RepID=A0A1D1UN62_RAMVA|nr:hypothetical protein RvY_01686 [Ramazzottius varieornatus]